MNYIKAMYNWLDGKKTKIFTMCFLLQDQLFDIWFPDGNIPPRLERIVLTIVKVGMFYGLGDALVKKKDKVGKIATVLIACLLLVGCNKATIKPPESIDFAPAVQDTVPKTTVIEKVLIPELPKMEPINETVYFDFDSYDLRESAVNKINSIIDGCYNRNVTLVGHACNIGEENYNFKLGHSRAEAIAGMFRGVASETTTESLGEGEPYSETDLSLNRRVEITVK